MQGLVRCVAGAWERRGGVMTGCYSLLILLVLWVVLFYAVTARGAEEEHSRELVTKENKIHSVVA